MRLSFAALAPLLLVLSGCWEAKAPLMPLSARDRLPIEGRYNILPDSKGDYVLLNLMNDRRYSLIEQSNGQPKRPSFVSFDEIEQLPAIAPKLARSSRVFIAQSEEFEGEKRYVYFSLITVDRGDDQFLTVRSLTTACSDAVRSIIGAAQGADCVFTSYAQVQAAAIDAVRWMNDARTGIHSVTYVRPAT